MIRCATSEKLGAGDSTYSTAQRASPLKAHFLYQHHVNSECQNQLTARLSGTVHIARRVIDTHPELSFRKFDAIGIPWRAE